MAIPRMQQGAPWSALILPLSRLKNDSSYCGHDRFHGPRNIGIIVLEQIHMEYGQDGIEFFGTKISKTQ